MERNFLPYGQKMRKAEEMKEPQFSPQLWFYPPEDLAGGPTSSKGSIVSDTKFCTRTQPLPWDQIHTEALVFCGQVVCYGDLHLWLVAPSDIWVAKGQKGQNTLTGRLKL